MSDIVLRLDRLERLYGETAFDPAQPGLPTGPAIDRVVRQLRMARKQLPGSRLVVELTMQPVTPALQVGAAEALREYCRQQAMENRETARSIRHDGWLALRAGVLLLAVSLGLSAMFDHFQPLPKVLNRLFSEGFLVLGWVVLWHPLETLLYGWLLPYRNARVFERIAGMTFVLLDAAKSKH